MRHCLYLNLHDPHKLVFAYDLGTARAESHALFIIYNACNGGHRGIMTELHI